MRISDWSADVCSSDLKGLDCSSAPQSWPRLVVRVLVAFFGGRSPAISRLHMAREYIEMPVDFMECWVTSLWALDNIEVLMPNNRANRDFLPYIFKLRVLMIKFLCPTSSELKIGRANVLTQIPNANPVIRHIHKKKKYY